MDAACSFEKGLKFEEGKQFEIFHHDENCKDRSYVKKESSDSGNGVKTNATQGTIDGDKMSYESSKVEFSFKVEDLKMDLNKDERFRNVQIVFLPDEKRMNSRD